MDSLRGFFFAPESNKGVKKYRGSPFEVPTNCGDLEFPYKGVNSIYFASLLLQVLEKVFYPLVASCVHVRGETMRVLYHLATLVFLLQDGCIVRLPLGALNL